LHLAGILFTHINEDARSKSHQTAPTCFGGVAAATPPNQPQLCILTDYFNNYNFSKLK